MLRLLVVGTAVMSTALGAVVADNHLTPEQAGIFCGFWRESHDRKPRGGADVSLRRP